MTKKQFEANCIELMLYCFQEKIRETVVQNEGKLNPSKVTQISRSLETLAQFQSWTLPAPPRFFQKPPKRLVKARAKNPDILPLTIRKPPPLLHRAGSPRDLQFRAQTKCWTEERNPSVKRNESFVYEKDEPHLSRENVFKFKTRRSCALETSGKNVSPQALCGCNEPACLQHGDNNSFLFP